MEGNVNTADAAVNSLQQDGEILSDTLNDHKYKLNTSLQQTKIKLQKVKNLETREKYRVFGSLIFFTTVVVYIISKRIRLLAFIWLIIFGKKKNTMPSISSSSSPSPPLPSSPPSCSSSSLPLPTAASSISSSIRDADTHRHAGIDEGFVKIIEKNNNDHDNNYNKYNDDDTVDIDHMEVDVVEEDTEHIQNIPPAGATEGKESFHQSHAQDNSNGDKASPAEPLKAADNSFDSRSRSRRSGSGNAEDEEYQNNNDNGNMKELLHNSEKLVNGDRGGDKFYGDGDGDGDGYGYDDDDDYMYNYNTEGDGGDGGDGDTMHDVDVDVDGAGDRVYDGNGNDDVGVEHSNNGNNNFHDKTTSNIHTHNDEL